MKKLVLIFGLAILLGGENVFADEGFKCAEPTQARLGVSNITGVNPLAEQIANAIITKQIKKEANGNFSTKIESYNVKSLKQGIFKSLEINGTNVEAEGFYASYVRLKTLCNYNHIVVNNKENSVTFKENFGMAYTVRLTEADLNRTIQNSSYGAMIRKVNSIGNTYKLFNITATSISIKDNTLYYKMKVLLPLFNVKQDVIIKTDFKVKNGEIVLDKANLTSGGFNFDADKLAKLINYLNPLEFSMNLFENKDANMQIKEMSIVDNGVNVSGIVTVDKDVVMY